MNDPDRGVRIDQFMVAAKGMLALIGILIVVIFVITVGSITDSRKQTLDAITDLRKQIDLLKDQNHWSVQDRAELHQANGEIREALKRLEGRQ